MSTSRCNVRVIANGTTSGPGGGGERTGGEGTGKNRHDDRDDAGSTS